MKNSGALISLVLAGTLGACATGSNALSSSSSSGAASTPFAGSDTDREWQVPRTAHGHPDLQGNWTNSTLTDFERDDGLGPVYTPEQVAAMESPDGVCPPDPGTVDCGRPAASPDQSDAARLSGQEYNEVYWDRGQRVAVVNGEPRSSLVTRPANGQVPPLTLDGQARLDEYRSRYDGFGAYDHPELRPLAERCIVSFGSSAGPPMIPNSAYNNNYTIVQNEDHVMILAEMVHDARIIRLREPDISGASSAPGPEPAPNAAGQPDPLPGHLTPWFGDSWGYWEGETLVVETTNLNPDHPFRGVPPSPEMRVEERFTRIDAETILYEFTVDDPTTWTEPWGGEIPMKRQPQRLYEYACHEGNYSLEGVLRGARYQEETRAEVDAGTSREPR